MHNLNEPSDAINKGPNCKLCIDRKVTYAGDDLLNWLYHMLSRLDQVDINWASSSLDRSRPSMQRTIRLAADIMTSC